MKISDIIKALWQAPQAITPAAAGNTSITMPALARRKVLTITPGVGSGAYTHVVYFPIANRLAGDEIVIRLRMPASANPTIELRDASAVGAVIKTWGGAGTAYDDLWQVVYNAGAWS